MCQDTDHFVSRSPEKIFQAQLQELVCYLWDNYIQLWDNATEVFLVGVGNAYLGVKMLLMGRGMQSPLPSPQSCSNIFASPSLTDTDADCKARITGVVNFVTGTLRPVKSDMDPDLSSWYKGHSQVYISSDHICWQNPDLTRKVHKRRFGTVKRSPKHGLSKMMQFHAGEAQRWMLERVGDDHKGGETTEEDNVEGELGAEKMKGM